MKNTLKLIKPDPKTTRILPDSKQMPLVPPTFEVELIDFRVKGIKWYTSLMRYDTRQNDKIK
jgi:hypothetical protein